MKCIENIRIINLLKEWESGQIGEKEVHERAESLWKIEEWPNYPKSDPRSIAIELLSHLDILNVQLITREDIPAMIEFLNTKNGNELEAWAKWENMWLLQ